jgi:hypothetical protein
MKTYRAGILAMIATCLTLFANSIPTWAGSASIFEISIYDYANLRYAKGSMSSARYSADSNQAIGCHIFTSSNQATATACYARDSVGTYVYCLSTNPRHVGDLQGMTDSSYIYFITDLTTGTCTFIEMYDGSNLLK